MKYVALMVCAEKGIPEVYPFGYEENGETMVLDTVMDEGVRKNVLASINIAPEVFRRLCQERVKKQKYPIREMQQRILKHLFNPHIKTIMSHEARAAATRIIIATDEPLRHWLKYKTMFNLSDLPEE